MVSTFFRLISYIITQQRSRKSEISRNNMLLPKPSASLYIYVFVLLEKYTVGYQSQPSFIHSPSLVKMVSIQYLDIQDFAH